MYGSIHDIDDKKYDTCGGKYGIYGAIQGNVVISMVFMVQYMVHYSRKCLRCWLECVGRVVKF